MSLLIFTVPPPSLVISSNFLNPTSSVGSTITLTCTMELSAAVDVPVTVNTVWTRPDGFTAEDSGLVQPVMGSTATFTSTTTVSSFEREKSGNYYCTSNINSIPPFLVGSIQTNGTAGVTVGKTKQ